MSWSNIRMASRSRSLMNQAVFNVTPSVRLLLIPFLLLLIRYAA